MTVSLQVVYPIGDDTTFDYDYYTTTHMQVVGEHMGPHLSGTHVARGIAGGPDTPPPYYAIATLNFADQDAMNAAMAGAGPVLADIANFTNVRPTMLIGEVVG